MNDIIELYDNCRNKINKKIRRYIDNQEDFYHEAINLYILNSQGQILIQKRSDKLKAAPSKWAVVVGAIVAGETSINGALRELKEEMNLVPNINNIEYIGMIKQPYCFMDVWLIREDFLISDINFNDGEAIDAKYVTIDEFEKMINSGEAACDTFKIFKYYLELNNKD